MSISLPGQNRRGHSPSVNIVQVLQDYSPKSVPIDFLANILGRNKDEIRAELKDLEKRGVIKSEEDKVWLSR